MLLIVVDTLRADYLGCYGHPRKPTPAIDSVAAAGARFDSAIAQGSWTAPSVVALMTGRYLSAERVDLPDGVATLAESFQAAGWKTGGFIMNDIVKRESGFARGFDNRLHQMVPYSENDPIVTWIEEHADEPTFTYVHLNEPHDPYLPPEGHRRWIDRPDPLPDARKKYYERVQAEHDLVDDLDETIAHIEREIGGYVDDVAYSDMRIAGLLDALERNDLTERTCVIVTSDHGEGLWTRVAFLGGQRGEKIASGQETLLTTLMPTHGNQVNHELVRVPLVMRSPGLTAGTVVRAPVESIDLFLTLLELCDLTVPVGLQGESLVPLLEGTGTRTKPAFSMTRFNTTVITADGWQAILPTALGECAEELEVALFDLTSDPEARVNVAEQHPERVRELAAIARQRRASGLPPPDEPISADLLIQLAGLGYTTDGVALVETRDVHPEFRAMETAELLRAVSESGNCLARFEAARALGERDLSDDERTRVRERLRLEGSEAVRDELENVLLD